MPRGGRPFDLGLHLGLHRFPDPVAALDLDDVHRLRSLDEQIDLDTGRGGAPAAHVRRGRSDESAAQTDEGAEGSEVVQDKVLELQPHDGLPSRQPFQRREPEKPIRKIKGSVLDEG